MLSRRNVRIKVMQCLYAYERDAFPSKVVAAKQLKKSLDRSYATALYELALMRDTAKYALTEAENRKAKHLPTEEDLNFNTKIAENSLVLAMDGPNFLRLSNLYEIVDVEHEELPKEFFRSLTTKPGYQKYIETENPTPEMDRKILLTLFNKVFLQSESFHDHMLEKFNNWDDDDHHIAFKINQLFEELEAPQLSQKLEELQIDPEDKDFAEELFNSTLENEEEASKLISPKLENWDIDRIAVLDMILMKMAVVELLYFKFIPIKVTINEYIEIAKMYSTPKSKDFVNGVLDKLMKELKDSGQIKKAGRGLLG